MKGESSIYFKKSLNKLVLPAFTGVFVTDVIHLHTRTHMPTSRSVSKWCGKDARRQVSGVLPDVTSVILDRSFVPIRIQQPLQGGALQQSFAFSILRKSQARFPTARCLCPSWAEGRSDGCDTATTPGALQALLLTHSPSVSSAARVLPLLFRLHLCCFPISL